MTASHKVLLVGEDPIVRKNLEQILAAKKYGVDFVSTGEDALWAVSDNEYDAVFTDLELRGINGLELAEAIQDKKLTLPIVILSASDSPSNRERAAAAGVKEFWLKALSQEQLDVSVGRVIKAAELAAAARPQKPERPRALALFSARIQSILLFFMAPLVGLAYFVLFPVIAIGMLGWFAIRLIRQGPKGKAQIVQTPKPTRGTEAGAPGIFKTIGMLIAVVLIGVTYGLVGPVFGFILVVWFALEAWGRIGARAIRGSETS